MPSGRTGTVLLIVVLFQTEISRTSSGPITYSPFTAGAVVFTAETGRVPAPTGLASSMIITVGVRSRIIALFIPLIGSKGSGRRHQRAIDLDCHAPAEHLHRENEQ